MHRPGVQHPRAHARKGLEKNYSGGVYSNTCFKGAIHSNKLKEGPHIY